MRALPIIWKVPLATVQGGGNVAYYIVKTGTSDGRSWATHKRFSEFVALRTTLLAGGQATKVGFPIICNARIETVVKY